ncbi:MAG: hypothetical protein HGB36_09190 [Chlorobiaceae bacterium]|jgi:hypothetical protein|nr:hypothetical protein [Chlorobiaceae bacterium]
MSREKIIIGYDTTGRNKWHIEIVRRNNDGKYCRIMDSDDADFPFDVRNFGPFDEDILIMQLKDAYPVAELGMKW